MRATTSGAHSFVISSVVKLFMKKRYFYLILFISFLSTSLLIKKTYTNRGVFVFSSEENINLSDTPITKSRSKEKVILSLDNESKLASIYAKDASLTDITDAIYNALKIKLILSDDARESAQRKFNIDLHQISFQVLLNKIFGDEEWIFVQGKENIQSSNSHSVYLCIGEGSCNHLTQNNETVFDDDDYERLTESDPSYIDDVAFYGSFQAGLRQKFDEADEIEKHSLLHSISNSDENKLFLLDVVKNDGNQSVKLRAIKSLSGFINNEIILLDLLHSQDEQVVLASLYFLEKRLDDDMEYQIYKRLFDTKSLKIKNTLSRMEIDI